MGFHLKKGFKKHCLFLRSLDEVDIFNNEKDSKEPARKGQYEWLLEECGAQRLYV